MKKSKKMTVEVNRKVFTQLMNEAAEQQSLGAIFEAGAEFLVVFKKALAKEQKNV